MKSKIKCAAVMQDGKIWKGHRHGDIIRQMVEEKCSTVGAMQGFVDEDENFLTRKEAYVRAVECGQIEDVHTAKVLLSEDLY